MQATSNFEQEDFFEQRQSELNPGSLNQIRSGRRNAIHTLKTKVSVVPMNCLHNLAYQRRNALIAPPRALVPSFNQITNLYEN